MKLHEYLATEGALTVAQLREAIGVKSDAQVRQWQHGYAGRQPNPEYCTAIEQATGGKVMRWDLRPDDWHRIWPELIGTKHAPRVPAGQIAGNSAPNPDLAHGMSRATLHLKRQHEHHTPREKPSP